MAQTPWIVAVLAPTLLLAACVTGAAPAPPPVVPMPEGASFTQLAVGRDHVCGLRDDSTAVCWGRNDEGQLDVPDGMRFRQLTAGFGFSCGLRLDGALVCWGRESADWLGGEARTWAMVSAGRDQLCALNAEGAVACWGSIGPPPVGPRYTAIGTGDRYGCGLTFTGDLECWGRNIYGQSEWRKGPFTALSVGSHHLCALRPDGSVFCQGRDYRSQILAPAESFTSVTAARASCGLTATGALVCWGPESNPPPGPFTALASGSWRTCGLRPDGTVECWEADRFRFLNVAPAPFFEGQEFEQPVDLFPWRGGLAVVERRGAITVHTPGTPPRLVLDLTARTILGGERGMLGAALDPEFESAPFLYVYYNTFGAGEETHLGRVSRFPVVDGRADAESELVILEFTQWPWHNGGTVRFGPDGMLYLGFGDSQHPQDAQDLQSLRGKIIRIDVRGASEERPYRVPDDNPLHGVPEARPEIWAWGLRNPWRMSFDADGRLWVADVGADAREEVSLVTPGANLGWPLVEGEHCHGEQRACDTLDATPPVATYGRDQGCAIIGGVHHPANGAYLFGDYCSGHIWMLVEDGETGWSMRRIAHTGRRPILAFGVVAGEVYVLIRDGPILRLELPP